MRRGVTSGLVAAALLFGMAGAAAAGDPPRPGGDKPAFDDAMTRDAQARFDEGKERVKAGDFEGARIKFTQAYSVLHSADILWNLALAEEKSGHVLEALSHFKQVVREAKSADDKANAKKHVDELMAKTAHVEVLAPAGTSVTMDGAAIAGVAPFADVVDCAPGHHVLEAKLAQGVKTTAVDAIVGQTAHVSFASGESAPAASAPVGVAAPSEAAVPVAPAPADTGVRPQSGATYSSGRTITVAVLGGLAVVATAAGVVFGMESQSDADRAASLRTQNGASGCANGAITSSCSQEQDALNAQSRERSLAIVSYAGAGVLAVGAVVAWAVWPRERGTGAGLRWIVPTVGAGAGGVAAGGRF